MLKSICEIAACAAGLCHGQVIGFEVSTTSPSDGETVFVDVVFDTTDYGGPFFALAGWSCFVQITATGSPVSASQLGSLDDLVNETAPTDTTGDGVEDFGPFGDPWTSGRRPGAFPGNGGSAGAFRFFASVADDVASIPGGVRIGSTSNDYQGALGGAQADQAVLGNPFIHRGRVLSVFRFAFDYETANETVTFDPVIGGSISVFTEPMSTGRAFIQNEFVGQSITIPSPGTAATVAAAGLAWRRRDPPHCAA